jgi:hypothetical protein
MVPQLTFLNVPCDAPPGQVPWLTATKELPTGGQQVLVSLPVPCDSAH